MALKQAAFFRDSDSLDQYSLICTQGFFDDAPIVGDQVYLLGKQVYKVVNRIVLSYSLRVQEENVRYLYQVVSTTKKINLDN